MFKGLQSSNQYSGNGKGKVCSKHILTLMSKQKVLSEYFLYYSRESAGAGSKGSTPYFPLFIQSKF
jgi:hypothetical protein